LEESAVSLVFGLSCVEFAAGLTYIDLFTVLEWNAISF